MGKVTSLNDETSTRKSVLYRSIDSSVARQRQAEHISRRCLVCCDVYTRIHIYINNYLFAKETQNKIFTSTVRRRQSVFTFVYEMFTVFLQSVSDFNEGAIATTDTTLDQDVAVLGIGV